MSKDAAVQEERWRCSIDDWYYNIFLLERRRGLGLSLDAIVSVFSRLYKIFFFPHSLVLCLKSLSHGMYVSM